MVHQISFAYPSGPPSSLLYPSVPQEANLYGLHQCVPFLSWPLVGFGQWRSLVGQEGRKETEVRVFLASSNKQLPVAGCYSLTKNKGHSACKGTLYTPHSLFFWYVPPPIILLGVGVVTAPSYCTGYISSFVFLYSAHTFVDSTFVKLSTNYASLSVPSVSCWTLTETDEVSIFKDLEYNKVSLT